MQRLDEIVDLYLKMDTNYALMITGEWGVGKTYYFKNILKDKISKTPVFNDHSKKYKPILVSLFGLKSIEEIQSEIFQCIYPFLKNTKLKFGTTIAKVAAKVMGFGDYVKYVEEINVNENSLIKSEEIVFCFDDLERISKDLNIEEFIGYVNTLVESENVECVNNK